jgi:ferric-dicitrate binding protein FerR (iron transport regulator)
VAAPNSKSCETCAVRLRGQDLLEARLRRAQRAEAELQAKRVAAMERKREYYKTSEGQAELRKQMEQRRRANQVAPLLLLLLAALVASLVWGGLGGR